MDVIFYETFKEERKAIRSFLPKKIKARFVEKTIQENKDVSPPAKLISIRTQSKIPLDWAKRIDGILSRSQGYDHLSEYRKRSGFDGDLGFLGNYCARSVAEHGVMAMLALMRRLNKQTVQFQRFDRNGLTGTDCFGKNACVVGVGNIGSQMANILKGLRMNVRGVDIQAKHKGIKYVPLSSGIRWAHVIMCALPLTEKTEGMLSYNVLKRAKKGSYFINIARGEISPAKDLKRLLKEGVLAGLAMDVYPQEGQLAGHLRNKRVRPSASNKEVLSLVNNENVLLTPHNAFNSKEALYEKARRSVQAIERYLKTKKFPRPVPRA